MTTKLKTVRKHTRRITLILNVVAILLLWTCCATTWVHPEVHPRLALAGLGFPVILLINLCFIVAWLLVDGKKCWVPLVGLLPCISYIIDYYPISFRNDVPAGSLKIVSWNCDGMGTQCIDKDEARRLSLEYLGNSDADIICLQEANAKDPRLDSFFQHMDSIGYEKDYYKGLIVMTKLHILSRDTIAFYTKDVAGCVGNGSFYLKLQYGNDTILLANNHLESNRLNADVKDEYTASIDEREYDKLEQTGRAMGGTISRSTALRGPQADSLVAFCQRNAGRPIILCGDFNDTPISYVYQRVKSELKNAYRESGTGLGISYNKWGFWVRIDHLFVSKCWQTYNTFIDKSIAVSDHYPLVSWLKMD